MTEGKATILVVDDEETVRSLLQRRPGETGFNVFTAANGQQALDKLTETEIDAVLRDIKMPGMYGMEVLEQITTN